MQKQKQKSKELLLAVYLFAKSISYKGGNESRQTDRGERGEMKKKRKKRGGYVIGSGKIKGLAAPKGRR